MSQSQTPYHVVRTAEGSVMAAARLEGSLRSLLSEIDVALKTPAVALAIRTYLDRTGRTMGSLTVLELLDLCRGGDGLALNLPNIEP